MTTVRRGMDIDDQGMTMVMRCMVMANHGITMV